MYGGLDFADCVVVVGAVVVAVPSVHWPVAVAIDFVVASCYVGLSSFVVVVASYGFVAVVGVVASCGFVDVVGFVANCWFVAAGGAAVVVALVGSAVWLVGVLR